MIAQGSNLPICFKNVPQSIYTAKDVSASVYSGKNLLKHWAKEELTFTDGAIIAPLTQEETMSFPHGFVRVTLKYSDLNGAIIPPIEINEVVGKRSDRTVLEGEELQLIQSVDYDLTEVDLETGKVIFRGYSPYVGDNGNWFAYDDAKEEYVDTEIKAEGPEGKPYEHSEEFSNLATEVRENTEVARTSATSASRSEENARVSAQESLNYKDSAKTHATNASASATNAKASETNAKTSETNARSYESSASESAQNALTYVGNASYYADESKKVYNDIQKKVADGTFKGEPGEKGDDGKSAYEVAVENGFVGDEYDWLASLKGEPGEDGKTPEKGVDYFDGKDGKDYILSESDKEEIAKKVHVEEKHITEYIENPYDDREIKEDLRELESSVEAIENKLKDYVEYATLTISCVGTDGSIPAGTTVIVKETGSDEICQTSVFNGSPVGIRIPIGFAYTVEGSDDLDIYYDPVSVNGIMKGNASVVVKYSKLGNIETYKDVQKIVQIGKADKFFSYDTGTIEVESESFGNLVFDVEDFDNHHLESDSTEHSMDLLLHDVLYGYQLNAIPALIACQKGLPKGTYNFTLGTTYGYWAAGTYQFTTTKDIPEGGQLKLSLNGGNGTALTSCTLQMYESPKSTTIMENIQITSGSDGQSLGSLGDMFSTVDGVYINHYHRVAYGGNFYDGSALDQWLNAEGTDWWNPATMFERPPSYLNQKGFLGQLPEGFRNVLGDVCVKCHTNQVYESPDYNHSINEIYQIKRKIYLASRMEIFGTPESQFFIDGSVQYAKHKLITENSERIKYDHTNQSAARSWWLRTPYYGYAYIERYCNSSGALDHDYSYNGLGAVPACSII